jgi:hypothetical protein
MNSIKLSILVALVFMGIVSTSAVATEPFDFRGARLGMSLSDFRKLPIPGGVNAVEVQAFGAVPELVCTDYNSTESKFNRVSVVESDEILGVIKCAWLRPPNQDKARYAWDYAMVPVGEDASNNVTFSFIKTPDASEHQLYDISIVMKNFRFSSVVTGLKERFGKPASTKTGEVQNQIGNIFSNTTITWRNDVSSIYLEERAGEINKMLLDYSHTALAKYYFAERKKITGTPGSKF